MSRATYRETSCWSRSPSGREPHLISLSGQHEQRDRIIPGANSPPRAMEIDPGYHTPNERQQDVLALPRLALVVFQHTQPQSRGHFIPRAPITGGIGTKGFKAPST